MDVLVVLALWLVLGIVLVLPPLLGHEVTPLYERCTWLTGGGTVESAEPSTGGGADPENPARGQPITDGGHRCHNCGATMDAVYTYCGECLMPRV